jgi:DNA-binding transcriptional LysR family regulator
MLWDDLRCFLAVANAGTLSGGAKDLGISVATIGRRLDGLEAVLGIRLVDRSPSGILLTTNGSEVLALTRAGATHLDGIQRTAASLRMADWPDPIRISATEPIVAEMLAPAVDLLFRMDPNIRVNLQSDTENARLASREAEPRDSPISAERGQLGCTKVAGAVDGSLRVEGLSAEPQPRRPRPFQGTYRRV